MKDNLYVTLDVEAAGAAIGGRHSLLSVGACIVPAHPQDLDHMVALETAFYAELAPDSLEYEEAAMRVACLHLECIEKKRRVDTRYDPTDAAFNPELVLRHMQDVCESPRRAIMRFVYWLGEQRSAATDVEPPKIMPIIDAPFFDPGHINAWLWLGKYMNDSPLGWSGHNLKDLWRGYTRRMDASLEELGVPKPRKPHHALHDAHELAEQARIVIFEKMRR